MKQILGPTDLGNELKTFIFIKEQGIKYPVAYYFQGVPQIDNALNGKRLYECGIAFHMISLEKGFCFVFGDIWKGDKFYVKREKILEVKFIRITMKQLVHNKFLTLLKSGVGGLFSMGVGHLFEKISGLKTKDVDGIQYRLWYADDNGEEKAVFIEVPISYKKFADQFLVVHWVPSLSK